MMNKFNMIIIIKTLSLMHFRFTQDFFWRIIVKGWIEKYNLDEENS